MTRIPGEKIIWMDTKSKKESISGLNPFLWNLMVGLGFSLFMSCAPVHVQPPSPPFDRQGIDHIVSILEEHKRDISTFCSSGRLMIKRDGSKTEADSIIAGIKDPLQIKIEVTHSWGRPLLHILIHEDRLHILSFTEKRYYFGHLGRLGPSTFFPSHLDRHQIWSFVSGYPMLPDYSRTSSSSGDRITFLGDSDEVLQHIEFYPESRLPCTILFPGHDITISFSDLKNDEEIMHACKTSLSAPQEDISLVLETKKMIFNRPVPKSIFELKKPDDFEVHSLDRKI